MNPWKALLRSRKFWVAVIAGAQTILFQYVPDFPQAVWLSIDAILGIVIVGITLEDSAEKLNGYHQLSRIEQEPEELFVD